MIGLVISIAINPFGRRRGPEYVGRLRCGGCGHIARVQWLAYEPAPRDTTNPYRCRQCRRTP